MKANYLFALLFLTFGAEVRAQNCISEALMETQFNELGDPLINALDADGSRQNDWIYGDVYGEPVLKEHYVNNQLEAAYFPRMTGEAIVWESTKSRSPNPDLQAEILADLTNAYGTLSPDQQLMLFFAQNGVLERIAPLGNWNENQLQSLVTWIQNFMSTHQINLSHATYVLL